MKVKVLNRSIRSGFCFRSHLLHRGVIKEDPFGGLGVEGEGTVVAAGVADHPHELQLPLFGVFIRHPVEELKTHTGYCCAGGLSRFICS